MNLFRVFFFSFSSVLIRLIHLGKFPLHRSVVSGKSRKCRLVGRFEIRATPLQTAVGMSTGFRGNDFWDGLGRQALAVIGQWYTKATSSQLCLGCSPKRSQKLLRYKLVPIFSVNSGVAN